MTRAISASLIALVAAVASAEAADLPAPVAPIAPPIFGWSGAHIGVFLGGGSGSADFYSPSRASLSSTTAPTPFVSTGGQVGYDYQMPASRLVIGVEADGSVLGGLDGSTTCLDPNAYVVPFNCRTSGKATAAGTGRIGYAFGPGGRTLGYVRGGVAALFEDGDITGNNSTLPGKPLAIWSAAPRAGFTVGAGIEQALSSAWSMRVEYDYADFGTTSLASPQTQQLVGKRYTSFSAGRVDDTQSLHEFKLGLAYHLGAPPDASFVPPDLLRIGQADLLASVRSTAPVYGFAPGYTIEVGGRYWYSFGRFQKDLGFGQTSLNNYLISRLTYQDTGNSGEFFGRIDTPARIFVKGFIGGGGEATGHLNDEDYHIITEGQGTRDPYSNTLLSERGSTFDYGTVDIGYSLFKTASTDLGAFVGYNRYKDVMATYGCIQLTSNQGAPCGGTHFVLPSREEISQDNGYNSLRLGLNGDIWLDRLRLQADAAYLPLSTMTGSDDHFPGLALRPDSGQGQGVQLELIASYFLTPNLSVGAGGRFWGLWDPNATEIYEGVRQLPSYSQRLGVTLQSAYRFNTYTPPAVVAKY